MRLPVRRLAALRVRAWEPQSLGNAEPGSRSSDHDGPSPRLAAVRAPAGEFFDPVPPSDLNRAIVEGIPGLLDDLDSDTGNVVLTFARIWTTLATGAIHSKDAAADWALGRLPEEHRPVLARARAIYLGDEEERWADLQSRALPHVEHVVREIERLTGSESSTEPADSP